MKLEQLEQQVSTMEKLKEENKLIRKELQKLTTEISACMLHIDGFFNLIRNYHLTVKLKEEEYHLKEAAWKERELRLMNHQVSATPISSTSESLNQDDSSNVESIGSPVPPPVSLDIIPPAPPLPSLHTKQASKLTNVH